MCARQPGDWVEDTHVLCAVGQTLPCPLQVVLGTEQARQPRWIFPSPDSDMSLIEKLPLSTRVWMAAQIPSYHRGTLWAMTLRERLGSAQPRDRYESMVQFPGNVRGDVSPLKEPVWPTNPGLPGTSLVLHRNCHVLGSPWHTGAGGSLRARSDQPSTGLFVHHSAQ